MSPPPWLLVCADFVRTGGMDRANLALAEYLVSRGTPIELVAHRVEPGLAEHARVTLRSVPRPFAFQVLGDPLLNAFGRRAASRVLARGGRVVVNGGNCDVADVSWVHYVHAACAPTHPRSWVRGPKSLYAHWKDRRDEARVLRRARVVIANSRRTARDVITRLGIPEERVRTVYCGTDPHIFRPPATHERDELRRQLGVPPDRRVVLFIGGLGDRRKGFDVLFSAWQQLARRSGWDAELWVIGRGRELPAWRDRIRSAGLDGSVKLLGFRRDVPQLLAAGDALVSPTRYEPYGLGVHEALCVGLPALVSATAGVAERYPADLGELLLPDPDDDRDLVARLERWRNTDAELRGRVARLSDELRRYTWTDMARSLVDVVERS